MKVKLIFFHLVNHRENLSDLPRVFFETFLFFLSHSQLFSHPHGILTLSHPHPPSRMLWCHHANSTILSFSRIFIKKFTARSNFLLYVTTSRGEKEKLEKFYSKLSEFSTNSIEIQSENCTIFWIKCHVTKLSKAKLSNSTRKSRKSKRKFFQSRESFKEVFSSIRFRVECGKVEKNKKNRMN